MQRILSIDTTTEFGGLALAEDGGVIDELPLYSPDGFAHILFEHLGRLLRKHGWRVQEIDCFAAAAGPGSFTGVRVGLAAVKGLAEANAKPVVAVSNLQAVSWFGTAPRRAAVLDARRGEIYGAVYDAELRLVQPERLRRFPDWLAQLPEGDLEFVSTDFGPFRTALRASRFLQARVTEAPRCLAGAIARIAALRLAAGEAADAAAVDANYVRRSDAELKWRDSPKGAP
jgi:tRNA threonylcarbamoyladenosine biosynthesis protein TsaB